MSIDVSSKQYDESQQQAINGKETMVVSSGAGAGKTTVLTKRYLRLIREEGYNVDDILSLTFTRKAAAQMHERIYRLLLENCDETHVQQEVNRFEEAVISTLDSFCGEIARNGCAGFGFPRDFSVNEEDLLELAKNCAIEFLVKNYQKKCLQKLIGTYGFDNIVGNLFVFLAVDGFSLTKPCDFHSLKQNQISFLNNEIVKLTSILKQVKNAILELEVVGKSMAKGLEVLTDFSFEDFPIITDDSKKESIVDNCKNILVLLQCTTLPMPGKAAKPSIIAYKEGVTQWRETAHLLNNAIAGFCALIEYGEIYILLQDFQQLFFEAKRNAGILSFRDVMEIAVETLVKEKELRNYYKLKFKHIMIDEFQDNNEFQKKLLYLLAERKDSCFPGIPGPEHLDPGKLFFVGDEKQSIYRFRGADVSVFKGLSQELAKYGGHSIELKKNYRSEPELINFFNKLFPTAFGKGDAIYEASFSPLQHRNPISNIIPYIEIWYKPEKENPEVLSSDESEGWYIATRIKALVEEKKLLIPDKMEEGSVKAADYGDCALLLRSGSNQIIYERAFRRLNIPYTVQSVRALFLEAPVNDIYFLLQLALFPDDRHAYAAVLRSPFVNLDDDVVLRILAAYKSPFHNIDNPQEEYFFKNSLSRKQLVKAYKNGAETYFNLQEIIDRVPITEVLRYLWYIRGYRFILLKNPAYHAYLEYYDYLFQLAKKADERGECLAVFLDFLRDNLGQYERIDDLEILREEQTGIRIMTIHKAKGLEFPVVCVANCGNSGKPDTDKSAPCRLSNEHGVVIQYEKKGYFSEYLDKKKLEQEEAEVKRLLYVALTRAETHLFISGCHNKNNKNINTPKGRQVFLNMVLKSLGWDGDKTPLECEALQKYIKQIPDITESEIYEQSERSRASCIPEDFYKQQKPVIRSALRRNWTATELNKLAQQYSKNKEGISEDTIAFDQGPVSILTEEVNEFDIHPKNVRKERESKPALQEEGIQTDIQENVDEHADENVDEFFDEKNVLPSLDIDVYLTTEEQITGFGTLCHEMIEYLLAGKSEMPFLPLAIAGLKDHAVIVNRARLLAEQFIDTFISAQGVCKSIPEMPFLLSLSCLQEKVYVQGRMDLVIEYSEAVWVIDIKTDRYKNPELYKVQMDIYRKAASEILNKPAYGALFYLRDLSIVKFEKTVDIDFIKQLIELDRS